MAAIGITGARHDHEMVARTAEELEGMGEPELAEIVASCSLDWWTEPNEEMRLLLGDGHALWYPEHYATLTAPAQHYCAVTKRVETLRVAVARALGTHPYAPLGRLTIQEVPELEPAPVARTEDGTPLYERDGYYLTPIEAMFYDELRETDLVFAVQPRLHSVSAERRPDFVIFTQGRPLVIEIDGHRQHSSRRQRTADAQRDRWFYGRGFDALRFTGSEVHADAQGCIRQVKEAIERRRSSR